MQYNLVRGADSANISVVIEGALYAADDNHPLFEEIVERTIAGDEDVVNLFDASHRAAARLENLSERVQVANSRVYVDQTEVEDVFAEQVVRFLDDGVDDWKPLVAFLEKVYSNTSPEVRENLSRWLKAEAFTILDNGNILGYRGLNSDYTSKHAGPGIINGKPVNANHDNSIGNVVEIAADLVDNDPARGCSTGLHVGTYAYASGWAGHNGVVVAVEVDPRHVRSVPFECESAKMRVSKYVVKDNARLKVDAPVHSYVDPFVDDYDEDEDPF